MGSHWQRCTARTLHLNHQGAQYDTVPSIPALDKHNVPVGRSELVSVGSYRAKMTSRVRVTKQQGVTWNGQWCSWLQGMKVAVIEGHDIGGTCVNRGCVPSKALLAASGRIREMKNDMHMKSMGIQVCSYAIMVVSNHSLPNLCWFPADQCAACICQVVSPWRYLWC
eukprot:GHUV01032106.1.p1 GENE.GHUV01032106.1~~GHUV01032106.1.p1  ORF type:complete len:167 (-),score=33.10 GHUV01032106.1:367-867(-)